MKLRPGWRFSSAKRALAAACLLGVALAPGCKKKEKDNFVHVDVYGQMNSRYESMLASRFRAFSRQKATLSTGRKILVGEVLEANFYDQLANPDYRAKAQIIVLNSEKEASVDPNLAAEFEHARKACTELIPCYLLIPNSVSGEQRDAAQQLLDFVAPLPPPPVPDPTPAPDSSAPAATPSSSNPQ